VFYFLVPYFEIKKLLAHEMSAICVAFKTSAHKPRTEELCKNGVKLQQIAE
jgi:hypothetical protein